MIKFVAEIVPTTATTFDEISSQANNESDDESIIISWVRGLEIMSFPKD